MKPSLFFETFTLHDSGLEKFDYYPNKQVCILEVELCNWMQTFYQEEEAEIILGDLIFNGVRQLEIEEDETLLSHTDSISRQILNAYLINIDESSKTETWQIAVDVFNFKDCTKHFLTIIITATDVVWRPKKELIEK